MTPGPRLDSVCVAIVDCEHKTAPVDESGDFFAVGTPAMRGNSIDYGEARRISASTFEAWTRRMRPRLGDLLLAREAPVGPVALIPPRENVAPGQRTVLLRPDRDRVDSIFLFYLLASSAQQDRLRALAEGSTVAHLNVVDVRGFRLPALPAVHEQRAIAEVLTALDDKIAANVQMVQTADELASAIVSSMIDPSRRVPLAEIAEVTMGSSPPGTSYNEEAVGAVFYQGVRDFGVRFPANRVWTTAPVRMARAGDTLVSVRAPVGEVNLAAEETCIGRGLASVRSRTLAPMTLFHVLKDAPGLWAPYEAEGTVFGSINRSQLEGLLVPTFVDGREAETEGRLAALGRRVALALAENASLAATRDALLPALMSGRLRVRDVERAVG